MWILGTIIPPSQWPDLAAWHVDTIANEYSQRNTPSIVYFKNFLGRSLKDWIPFFSKLSWNYWCWGCEALIRKSWIQDQRRYIRGWAGARCWACCCGRLYGLTRARRWTPGCSPCRSTSRRQRLAGLSKGHLMTDTSVLALAYGKTFWSARFQGSHGTEVCGVPWRRLQQRAEQPGGRHHLLGRGPRQLLLHQHVPELRAAGVCQKGNWSKSQMWYQGQSPKALNKLRLAVEKIKKQMLLQNIRCQEHCSGIIRIAAKLFIGDRRSSMNDFFERQ